MGHRGESKYLSSRKFETFSLVIIFHIVHNLRVLENIQPDITVVEQSNPFRFLVASYSCYFLWQLL